MLKNKTFKKLFLYSFLSFVLSSFLTFIYIYFPKLPNSFDNKMRDYLFTIRGEIPNNGNVTIIDIDEVSLEQLGQWPWSRNIISKIVENLTSADIGIIGFDVVFAERDNSSPDLILKKFGIEKENIPNYDLEFSKTIANSPVILGYQFELEKDNHINKTTPKIPTVFIEKNKTEKNDYSIKASGTILNIPQLQENSYSSGFFNNIPDQDGIIRSVPLLISYDDSLYPSLSLEMIRVITNSKKIIVDYDEDGISNIILNDLKIPTDRYGRILVNFRGKEKNFKYYSALDIYNNNFNKEELQGKIALIGTSASGLLDLRATPFESIYPGVEVHANVIDNILQGDFIYKSSWFDGVNIIIIFTLSILVILLITYTPFWLNPIIFLFFSTLTIFTSYKLLFTYGIVLNIFFPLTTILLATMLGIVFDYFYTLKKEEVIKAKFASKVSKNVMDELLKDVNDDKLKIQKKEITIFFSDIREFTKISEYLDNPETLINYLNNYLTPMSEIVNKYDGTIDKYIGDCIMAYWNAPFDIKDHADKALESALEQLEILKILNEQLIKKDMPKIDIGIGITTGIATIGEIGSIGRSDFTIIGDNVNIASRIESLCKYYGSNLIISQDTKDKLKNENNYIFRFLDYIQVKGKEKPIMIWEVINKNNLSEKLEKELTNYNDAIELYYKQNFKEAIKKFEELENNYTSKIYTIFKQRAFSYLEENLPFNKVYVHKEK
jgi:adenylate cyclase